MIKLIEVKAIERYKIFVRYNDGTEGVVDLKHLAGKGVFKIWENPGFFEKVYVDNNSEAIAWNDSIDIDPITIYSKITGKEAVQINYY